MKKIDTSKYDRIAGMAWSPDGRYLAYGFFTSPFCSHIRVLDTTSGRVRVSSKEKTNEHSRRRQTNASFREDRRGALPEI